MVLQMLDFKQLNTGNVQWVLGQGRGFHLTSETLRTAVDFLEAVLANPYESVWLEWLELPPAKPGDSPVPSYQRQPGSPAERIEFPPPPTALARQCIEIATKLLGIIAEGPTKSQSEHLSEAIAFGFMMRSVLDW
jgi:hypothetical protein